MALTNRVDVGSAAAETSALRWQVVRVPVPGGSDDRLEIMLGGPADRTLCQGIVSDQNWRVAFAPWPVFDIEISAYDMLNSLKQLLHGCAMSGPEIQRVARAVIQEMLDRAGMRIGEIENV